MRRWVQGHGDIPEVRSACSARRKLTRPAASNSMPKEVELHLYTAWSELAYDRAAYVPVPRIAAALVGLLCGTAWVLQMALNDVDGNDRAPRVPGVIAVDSGLFVPGFPKGGTLAGSDQVSCTLTAGAVSAGGR